MNIYDTMLIAEAKLELLEKLAPDNVIVLEHHCEKIIDKASTEPEMQLAVLYKLMEEIYAYVNKFTPCQKGCTQCCDYGVTVSELEIIYIEKHNQVKRKNDIKGQQAVKDGQGIYHGNPCPFITDDGCAIYQSRPYVCRRHVTVAPDNFWCDAKRCDQLSLPLVRFRGLDQAFKRICERFGNEKRYDIRQVFT